LSTTKISSNMMMFELDILPAKTKYIAAAY
jgi:hypothetical protein